MLDNYSSIYTDVLRVYTILLARTAASFVSHKIVPRSIPNTQETPRPQNPRTTSPPNPSSSLKLTYQPATWSSAAPTTNPPPTPLRPSSARPTCRAESPRGAADHCGPFRAVAAMASNSTWRWARGMAKGIYVPRGTGKSSWPDCCDGVRGHSHCRLCRVYMRDQHPTRTHWADWRKLAMTRTRPFP